MGDYEDIISSPFVLFIYLASLLVLTEAAVYQRTLLPTDYKLDTTYLIRETSSDQQKMSVTACAGLCRMQKACFYFTVTEMSCQMYHRIHFVAEANPLVSSYYEVPSVLMLPQDISDGQFFPGFTGSWALNKNDENAMRFSRLDEIDNYLGDDVKYHLKICYKELNLGDNCYYFEQDSDPRSPPVGSVTPGFELLSHPPGQPSTWNTIAPLTGLTANLNQAWIDGNNNVHYWFGLGMTEPWNGALPAIYQSPTLPTATHVELYIIPM